MKNTNYIINGVLVVAVIILFILQLTGKKNTEHSKVVLSADSTYIKLPVAYVNIDSLLNNYNFAKDLNETMLRKVENSRAVIYKQQQQLQKEMMEFQRKANDNAFLSNDHLMQERDRLGRKQQELEELAGKTSEEFRLEQAKANQQLSDTIISILKRYNNPKKYEVIFSNQGSNNILIADDSYNITVEIIDYLNKRYIPIGK